MFKGKVLVVDDDAFFRTLCADVLRDGGFLVETASSGVEAIRIVNNDDIDIVLTDLVMPDMSGLDVLEKTKQKNTLIDVVVITGHGSLETAISALKKGAFDYIRKPLNEDELIHTMDSCMEKKALLEENQEMRQSMKLFEVSRAIITTLDTVKLYNISIDAMLQIVPAAAGMIVFYEENGGKLDIKALRHMDMKEAESIVGAFKERFDREKLYAEGTAVVARNDLGELAPGRAVDFNSIVAAPVMKGKCAAGYILLLSVSNKEVFGAKDLKNADFIAEHASQAFENARKYSEAKGMAFVDSLTNLYNGKYLENALDNEIKRADRLRMPVTVLFIDLDNFKKINDTNDHLIGSRVLIEVAGILLQCVREVDTVVRYGGDEYVVVLIDADYNTGFIVADRIRATIETHCFLKNEDYDIRITASIGVATYPVHTRDKRELLKMADKAMYH
ncbi:MAG: diguanylate cyclase, partial [Deltaproteobacteria bacterium]|nr:diguanylate cyclase [Deltaproteobacteria bacterium]